MTEHEIKAYLAVNFPIENESDKLSDVLDEAQKKNKIKNLLQELRKEGKIHSPEYGFWEKV